MNNDILICLRNGLKLITKINKQITTNSKST